ncbi:MAG TPA: KGG domain-containing protein [Gemmatimonadaceae bacterium]|nr:KGG domain-containing protein [Gemmatimonadaceae bacterium]
MANRAGNDDRSFGSSDRERQRDVINEPGRNNSMSASSNGNASSTGGRKSARGFASMDQSKQKEIASKGGRAAHAKGTAHEFDSSEARAAGRKGGMAVSRNREHMAAIGRRGGEARGQRARLAAQSAQSGTQSTQESQAGAAQRSGTEGARQNTPAASPTSNTRGTGSEREVGISGTSIGATQNTRGGENALGGERRTPSQPAGGMEGSRGEERA